LAPPGATSSRAVLSCRGTVIPAHPLAFESLSRTNLER
jgi:hypothetical protein